MSIDDLRDHSQIDAHKKSERHRVRTELHHLEGTVAADEVDDLFGPGTEYKPERRNNPEKLNRNPRRKFKHWKRPEWKRRTARRQQKIQAEQALRDAN